MFSLYKTLKRLAVLSAHPVGEIYMTTDNTFNPQTQWGGVWEKITDRFLVGAGHTYSIGATGGETTHKLTVDEMPSHNHKFAQIPAMLRSGSDYSRFTTTTASGVTLGTNNIDYTGGSQPHNNLPPYLAVNIWKRTA